MISLTLMPTNETVRVPPKARVLDALLAKGADVAMACGGNGLCATCHVKVTSGMGCLTPPTAQERRTLSILPDADGHSRLACQCRVVGPGVEVEAPKAMFLERAEDLTRLLGQRADRDIRHPVTGRVLVSRGKLITRGTINKLKGLNLTEVTTPSPAAPPPKPAQRPASWPTVVLDNPPSPIGGLVSSGNDEFAPTRTVGKCLLIEEIGRGGTCTVFRALHTSLNIPVAVKAVNKDLIEADPGLADKFKVEARLLARLNHPNIVRVMDFEHAGGRPYLVLEHVEGLSLKELIEQSGQVNPDRALMIARQTVEALRAAWRAGIVHRDVKPGNILMTRDGRIKLADLGLAIVFGAGRPDATPRRLEGTVAYISPEQSRRPDAVDFRADIYSLGATLYHAVTGRLPFTGKSPMELVHKLNTQDPTPAHEVNPPVPREVSRLIERMMERDPARRFADYGELIEEFDRVAAGAGAPGTKSHRAVAETVGPPPATDSGSRVLAGAVEMEAAEPAFSS